MEDRDLIAHLGLADGFKEMRQLMKEVPKSGQISIATAKVLEMKLWLIVQKLTDMLTKAERYERNKKLELENAETDLASEAPDEVTSEAGKTRYARSTSKWRKLKKEAIQASVLKDYILRKREDTDKGIYIMRNRYVNEIKDKRSMPTDEV